MHSIGQLLDLSRAEDFSYRRNDIGFQIKEPSMPVHEFLIPLPIMPEQKPDYSFWTKYKKFAGNEIMLYVIMVVGIVLGIIIVSYFKG